METDKPLTPAAERILTVAGKLFYDNGIHAVGVDTIAAEAGVTKKTLYDRFGSKAELVALYLWRRDVRWRERVHSFAGRRSTPARRLLAVFDALADWLATENTRGCAFVNAHAELPEADHPGRQVIAASKRWLLGYLRDIAAEAGVRNPARLAEALLILVEGATVAASLDVTPTAVATAKRVAKSLIEEATGS
ncbi:MULTISPECIES: TetR/AcrR family transcriptional regulator [Amycolatopsis]|uniref:TetR/AcrR family transcriptional regulator n=1 Tax=Amycolatopsis thermalba TaxID=944492 RepID=A0ABY4P482_9PSEU|nr:MULTISPECIES: TetR/AcrR family transcriptional regulator [Amycolatopsis]OXM73165.1 TetR family transcriptional regulator [Amycolatopsis sp. KNN50.9b]UQS27150.1 TetR/AcrR family transcriptional regulator [Amycolatopsis thermalba]